MRAPQIGGRGSWPMADEPMLINKYPIWRAGEGTSKRYQFNACQARGLRRWRCHQCADMFEDKHEAAQHSAKYGHITLFEHKIEIVPVCTEEFSEAWEDGAGVCLLDRKPELDSA